MIDPDQFEWAELDIHVPKGLIDELTECLDRDNPEDTAELCAWVSLFALRKALSKSAIELADTPLEALELEIAEDEDGQPQLLVRQDVFNAVLANNDIPEFMMNLDSTLPAATIASLYLNDVMERRHYDEAGVFAITESLMCDYNSIVLEDIIYQAASTTQKIECPGCRARQALAEFCGHTVPASDIGHLH